jgi:nucleoside 2-deoxyribosyltransferase
MEDSPIFAFVLMPFDAAFDDLYRFGIKEPAERLGIMAERVDEQIYSEGILERIYRQIELADIIIADMSGQNFNVFYEIGYAHAKSKLCIRLTKDPSDIPFDLKHRRHVIHGGSIKRLEKALIDELRWAVNEIENVRTSRIKINLVETCGILEKNSYRAQGNIDFKIDMSNESERPSAEIEAMYFYTSKVWRLTQGQQECQGKAILRLVTSDGYFDHELKIDVDVDEYGF